MKNYIVLNSMIDNQKDVLCTAFDKGYKQGFEDGKESVQIDETEAYLMGTENAAKQFQPELKRAYNDGMNDAWDAARKICTNWCISDACLAEIFGKGHTIDDIMRLNSASEAIAKIKAWEEKKKQEDEEIKVGDEIKFGDRIGVIVKLGEEYVQVIWKDGNGGIVYKEKCKKTGRYFEGISEMLEKMKEVAG